MEKEFRNQGEAPRPSSLRSLVAWFFVLSFADYQDRLIRPSAVETSEENLKDGHSAFESRLRQLTWWPPDVFAITSSVLKRTGVYRLIVGPDSQLGQNLWRRLDWPQRVEAHGEAWRSVISRYILEPLDLKAAGSDEEVLNGRVPKYQVRADEKLWEKLSKAIEDRCGRRSLDERAFPFNIQCQNLLEAFIHDIVHLRDADGDLADQNLLAVSVKADAPHRAAGSSDENVAARFFEAIIGLHILADAASGSIGMPRKSTNESAVFDGFANVLLTLRGSLSTAPKFFGVVLPKMRTPQKGLTLRNLSHNLTYHDCEVEVMWRSFPWANFDENTLNVLYVPYPFDLNPKCFEGDTQHYESVGYFTYDPGRWEEVSKAVQLIDNVRKRGVDPHILVFTETAFNEETYTELLELLSASYGSGDPRMMPMVVAGVSRRENSLIYNELRMATHFAGKWYELSQQKHHRWQLDERQIRQYGLQGHLSTARPLFERNVVGQRRLTFYAPTPWLVLCPLICEDLARIEPASELIRGIGPTLVLALLLDGPQMDGRWPARYASVLADDPGTGVLTVTSYGAASASRKEDEVSSPVAGDADPETSQPVVVASWKDATSRFVTLPAAKDQALLITLTARAAKEFTLDGRASNNKAASFRLDGIKSFNLATKRSRAKKFKKDPRGNWSDIREVTAMTYVASAALSLLRPHRSHHPKHAGEYTDNWNAMWDWNRRCLRVRQLIDVMLGCPVLSDPVEWEHQTKQLMPRTKGGGRSSYDRVSALKAKRHLLLQEIFSDQLDGHKRARNRHLFAVMGSSQHTRDVKVINEETKWPTDSLRYASTVLRILFDTISGKDIHEKLTVEPKNDENASQVYRNRLIVAGSANRLGGDRAYRFADVISQNAVDVKGAAKPLISYKGGSDQPVQYLKGFQLQPPPPDERGHPKGAPNPYDFYRMILELIDGILNDKQAALWKKGKKEFNRDPTEKRLLEKEMRRLTLLILMMVPALIHEQLEFDYVRLKERNETALGGLVIHSLMQKSQRILTEGSRQARLP